MGWPPFRGKGYISISSLLSAFACILCTHVFLQFAEREIQNMEGTKAEAGGSGEGRGTQHTVRSEGQSFFLLGLLNRMYLFSAIYRFRRTKGRRQAARRERKEDQLAPSTRSSFWLTLNRRINWRCRYSDLLSKCLLTPSEFLLRKNTKAQEEPADVFQYCLREIFATLFTKTIGPCPQIEQQTMF